MTTAWDFVEKYYPNYHRCNEIARNDDLHKILDDEIEPDSAALELYENLLETRGEGFFTGYDYAQKPEFDSYVGEHDAMIYKKAIEGYIQTLNSND